MVSIFSKVTGAVGGMPSIEAAGNFSKENQPTDTVSNMISNFGNGVKSFCTNVLYNGAIRLPYNVVSRGIGRNAANIAGLPYTIGHKLLKVGEDIIDYPIRNQLAATRNQVAVAMG